MKLLHSIASAASAVFRRPQIDREMDDELRVHIQHRADDLERTGMPRREAQRRARIEFGGYERYKVECHESTGGQTLETVLQDLRFGLRMLRKSPGFTCVAILTLAFGIGANAVVFSLLNALVLRPLDVPQAQNLFMIERGKDRAPSNSYPDYIDMRDRNRAFDGLVAYEIAPAGLNTGGTPEQVWLYETSGNYFDALGIQPYLGRFFHSADEHGPNSAPFLVLSYGYWQSHFQGDRSVVGRVVQLNRYAYTILGVAPPEFRGTELFFAPQVWAPKVNVQQIEGSGTLDSRGQRGMWLVGRLRPGVSAAQATADLNNVGAWLSRAYPHEDDGTTFSLARPGLVGDMLGGPVRAFIAGLMLLSGLILLAACTNLGSLFASRAADRGREIAVRLALGSSRTRVLRQMLVEAMLIGVAGALAGVATTIPLLRALSAWQPIPNFPISVPVNPDWHTYALALILAVVSGLLFGLVPVRQVMKADPYQSMKAGASIAAAGRRLMLRDVLLVGQIAVCALLVTSSLVSARGMLRSLHSNFGFTPDRVIQANTDVGMGGYHGEQAKAMQRRILDALARVPGVTAAGYADRVPLNVGWADASVFSDTTTDYRPSNIATDAMQYDVSPGYLEAAATPLLFGRSFTWDDDAHAPRVAVVNQEFARKMFGSEARAVGNAFKIWGGTRVQVVGVVGDGKYRTLSEDPQPAMFFPILQSPSSYTWFIVRSNRDTAELGTAVQQTLRELNTGLPFTVNTWTKELDTALFAPRAASLALGVLGVLGAMLAVTGIFGMAAYSVSKRLRELGIRIALGAGRRQVLSAALGRAFRLLAFGSLAGLLLGLAATKVLSFIVYQATPRDPVVLGGVVLFMLLLGLLATWIPARRALATDPLALLRDE
jgi:predicted permease